MLLVWQSANHGVDSQRLLTSKVLFTEKCPGLNAGSEPLFQSSSQKTTLEQGMKLSNLMGYFLDDKSSKDFANDTRFTRLR